MRAVLLRQNVSVRSVLAVLLAATIAMVLIGFSAGQAGATTFALVEGETQKRASDEPLAALLSMNDGQLTGEWVQFYEDNVLIPGFVPEQRVESEFGDSDADGEPGWLLPWNGGDPQVMAY